MKLETGGMVTADCGVFVSAVQRGKGCCTQTTWAYCPGIPKSNVSCHAEVTTKCFQGMYKNLLKRQLTADSIQTKFSSRVQGLFGSLCLEG